jgi:hypothetical protein
MTEDERAALVEQIARQICFHRGAPACACAGWCRAPVANLLDPLFSTVAQSKAILAAIEPTIRADERGRVVAEATTDEAVERATAVHFDGQPDRATYNRVRRQTRAAIRAALGVPHEL